MEEKERKKQRQVPAIKELVKADAGLRYEICLIQIQIGQSSLKSFETKEETLSALLPSLFPRTKLHNLEFHRRTNELHNASIIYDL
jgi:hypothetical protein